MRAVVDCSGGGKPDQGLGAAGWWDGSATVPVAGEGGTILLVDDNRTILHLLQTLLEDCGYRVLAAATPFEALRLAKQHDGMIDLLLTDILMPEMDGLELAQRVLDRHHSIKTLYMSGYPGQEISLHSQLKLRENYLRKPFSHSELLATIRTILTRNSDADHQPQ